MEDQASAKVKESSKTRQRSALAHSAPAHPTTILLSVAGLTPQVITETLYCLLVQARPPVDIQEVHVLTTQVGAEQVRKRLLHPRDGWFHRFCRDYRIPAGGISFDAHTIHVPAGTDGRPLEDVRTPEDNTRVADEVLALVRDLTRNPAVALHASVAGGRKTMGLFLGIAFQLCARRQDRLSHVLISPSDLEGHSEFYYPPPDPRTYEAQSGKRIRSREARIELAEVPTVLLRERLDAAGLNDLSFSALVAKIQQELDRDLTPPTLRVESAARTLRIGDDSVKLTPLGFALYWIFAKRRVEGCQSSDCPGCLRCGMSATDCHDESIREGLRSLMTGLGARDERALDLKGWVETGRKDADPNERFLQTRSRINQMIRRSLGAGQWANRYLITARGNRPDTIYYLPLPPVLIRLS